MDGFETKFAIDDCCQAISHYKVGLEPVMLELLVTLLLLHDLPKVTHVINFETRAVVDHRHNNFSVRFQWSSGCFKLELTNALDNVLKFVL